MTGVPNFYSMTIHVRHQQGELLAEARRERRVAEAERGARNRLPASRHLAVVTGVLLLALLLAVSVASA
jgi:hypothetical protein